MISEEDIIQAREKEKILAGSYLKGITDFVKWTSTIAVAAILWIGNGITSIAGLPWKISIAGLVFLVLSLAIAVFAAKRILTAWATEWASASEEHTLYVLKKWKAVEPTKLPEKEEVEQIYRYLDAVKATRPFTQPTGFSAQVSWHIALLLVGLLLYVCAQVLSVL